MLLGLIAEGEGVAAQVLVRMGSDLGQVRRVVLDGGDADARESGITWDGVPQTGEPSVLFRMADGKPRRRVIWKASALVTAGQSAGIGCRVSVPVMATI